MCEHSKALEFTSNNYNFQLHNKFNILIIESWTKERSLGEMITFSSTFLKASHLTRTGHGTARLLTENKNRTRGKQMHVYNIS